MIDVNDLRKGTTFELDGNLFKVLEYSHHKPGRGNATIRVKAVNLRSGTTLEKPSNPVSAFKMSAWISTTCSTCIMMGSFIISWTWILMTSLHSHRKLSVILPSI